MRAMGSHRTNVSTTCFAKGLLISLSLIRKDTIGISCYEFHAEPMAVVKDSVDTTVFFLYEKEHAPLKRNSRSLLFYACYGQSQDERFNDMFCERINIIEPHTKRYDKNILQTFCL